MSARGIGVRPPTPAVAAWGVPVLPSNPGRPDEVRLVLRAGGDSDSTESSVTDAPWAPEGGWPHLQIGAELRIRINGECHWERGPYDFGHDWELGYAKGGVLEEERVDLELDPSGAHRYYVRLIACPCNQSDPGEDCFEWFAAAELEPADFDGRSPR